MRAFVVAAALAAASAVDTMKLEYFTACDASNVCTGAWTAGTPKDLTYTGADITFYVKVTALGTDTIKRDDAVDGAAFFSETPALSASPEVTYGTPVVVAGTAVTLSPGPGTSATAASIVFPITIKRSFAALKLTGDCTKFSINDAAGATNDPFDCAGTKDFDLTCGFAPLLSISQPDMPAWLAAGGLNLDMADVVLSVRAPGQQITSASGKLITLATSPSLDHSVAFKAGYTGETEAASSDVKTFILAKVAAKQSAGTTTFKIPAGKFTNAAGWLSGAASITTPTTQAVVSLTIAEKGFSGSDKPPAMAAAGWYAPTSIPTLTITGTGMDITRKYTWSQDALDSGATPKPTVGLFKDALSMPGATWANPAGFGATAGTASATAIPFDLDLNGAGDDKPTPAGVYRISLPGGAVFEATAPTYVDLKVGFPTSIDFQDVNFTSLRDAAVTGAYQTVPIAAGTGATATVYAVVTVSVAPGQEAYAVAMAESFGATPVLLSSLIDATTNIIEADTPSRFTRVGNNTLSIYYKLNLATIAAVKTSFDMAGGAICGSVNGVQLCNAVARAAGTLVQGDFPAATAGTLTLDGKVAVDGSGKPTYATPVTTGVVSFTVGKVLGTPSELRVQGPWVDGAHVDLTDALSAGSTAGDAQFTISASTKAGRYLITAPAGKWKAAVLSGSPAAGNSRVMAIVHVGVHPVFLPGPVDANDDLKLSYQKPQRGLLGPFVTADNDLRIRVYGVTAAAALPLYDAAVTTQTDIDAGRRGLLKGVYAVSDIKDRKVNLAPGLTFANDKTTVTVGSGYADWRVGVAGLADGEYVFVIDSAADMTPRSTTLGEVQVRLVIDRKAPVVAPAVYSGPAVFAGLGATPIPFPGSLVTDAGAPDSAISVSVDSIDARGFIVSGGSSLSTATLVTPYAARYPANNVVLSLKLTDDAAFTAKTTFTIPVRQQPGSLLTVIDKRGVQSRTTLYTGSPASLTSSNLPLKVVVDFDEAVYGVTKDSLICTVEGKPCTAAIGAPTSTSSDRRYTFDFSVTGSTIPTGSEVILQVSGKGVYTKAGGVTVKSSGAVKVVVDKTAPSTGSVTFTTTAGAIATFFIPTAACWDSTSANDKLAASSSVPSTANGMLFTRGFLGVASLTGNATIPATTTSFAVKCVDEAGNEGIINVDVVVRARAQESDVDVNAVLSVPTSQLTFTEGDADLDISGSSATFTYGASTAPSSVTVSLEKPEADETGPKVEKLTLSGSGATTGYTAPSSTDSAIDANGYASITAAVSSAAGVANFVNNLKYSNNREGVTSGVRTLRVTVYRAGAVVASVSRSLKVTGVNDAPIISTNGLPAPSGAWVEGAADTTILGSGVTFTDKDDTDFTGATLTVKTTDTTVTNIAAPFKACDKERDFLYLDPTYAGAHKAAKVTGTWVPSACQFVLTPLFPAVRVSNADLAAALEAVKYTSLDPENPVGYLAPGPATADLSVKRFFTATITDDGNAGRMAAASNTNAAPTDTNQATAWQSITITSVDDAPTVDYTALFAPSGPFYGKDSLASFKELSVGGKNIKTAKLTVVIPVNATRDAVADKLWQFQLDLSQVMKGGAPVNGVFANGAIVDVDSTTLGDSVVKLEVKMNAAKDEPGSTFIDAGTVAATSLLAGTAAGVSVKRKIKDTAVTNSFALKDDTAATEGAATSFKYGRYDNSTLYLNIKSSAVSYAKLGEYEFRLTIGNAGATPSIKEVVIPFFVDVVYEACKDSTADSTLDGSRNTIATYVVTSLNTANGAAWYNLAQTASASLGKFYPKNSLCVYDPTPFPPASASSYVDGALPIPRGGFDTKESAIKAAAAALADSGASEAARIAALASLRKAAAGAFNLAVPAGSLEGAGSVSISADSASTATKDILKVSLPDVSAVQLDVAVKLGPSGTTFSKAVQVCVFSGDTESGKYKVLSVASQLDPNDETRGYTPFEPLTDQSFDVASGKVCGYTKHFSLFAPIVQNIPTNPIVPKLHLMGGSCPNQCTGHGSCRQDGRCVCFAGFGGYDCSMRSCPSGESWGEDQATMHMQSECSGRGVCDRGSGSCSCFDGYEGAACERMACPNDCNRHGKCRLLAELPEVQKAGYSQWEAARIQVCQCDAGYMGRDCSERLCPRGDDPETTCWENVALGVADVKRQVQRVSLSFDAPASATVSTTTDEFALFFRGPNDRNFTTQRVEDVWAAGAESRLAAVLKALPEYSVKDVSVSADPGNSATKKDFLVTFIGDTTSGDLPLLQCLSNTNGLYACTAPGCQPRFNQLRMLSSSLALNNNVMINEYAVLEAPPTLDGAARPSGEWNVETTLILRKYELTLGSQAPSNYFTYEFASTEVYGNDGTSTAKKPVTIEETAVPPDSGPALVQGPYGLAMDLNDVDAYITAYYSAASLTPSLVSGGAQETAYAQRQWTASVTIRWALPTCTVTEESPAEAAYESAECGNRGLCNRDTGECECFDGYTGYSCAQQTVYV